MSAQNGDLPNGWVKGTIDELCALNPKHDNELSDETPVSFVPMAAVSDVLGTITEAQVRILGEVRKGYTHFADGDVIFAKITPCMANGKAASVRGMINGLACSTTEFYVFRPRGSRFAQILRGFKDCGRVSVAEEAHHVRDPDHSQ
jgi:type I restriction enzyme S subunit